MLSPGDKRGSYKSSLLIAIDTTDSRGLIFQIFKVNKKKRWGGEENNATEIQRGTESLSMNFLLPERTHKEEAGRYNLPS